MAKGKKRVGARKAKDKAEYPWRGIRWPKPWCRNFLDAIVETRSVQGACRSIGVSKKAVYALRRSNERFAEMWDEARWYNVGDLITNTLKAAIDGVEKPLHHQGELTGDTVTEYDNRLRTWMLERMERGEFHLKEQGTDMGPGEIANSIRDALAEMDESISSEAES